MCRTKKWNLSYECLTSYEAREALRKMKTTDPEFWKELTMDALGGTDKDDMGAEEDHEIGFELFDDDSDLPGEAIIAHVLEKGSPIGVTSNMQGDLMSAAQAESLEDDIVEPSNSEPMVVDEPEVLGVGKRKRKANTLYNSSQFWRHHDNDDPNVERYT
jgi:hypothetical protein